MTSRSLVPAALVCGAALFAAGCGGDGSSTTTIKLIEHAETDTVQHIGPPKEEDSAGDVLAFANPVFDSSNKTEEGTDNGACIRTAPGEAWDATTWSQLKRRRAAADPAARSRASSIEYSWPSSLPMAVKPSLLSGRW